MLPLTRYLAKDYINEPEILGMSFEDAYETIFSKVSDITFQEYTDSEKATHMAQEVTDEYLKFIHFDEMDNPEALEKTKQIATTPAIITRRKDVNLFDIYKFVCSHIDEDTHTLINKLKVAMDPNEPNRLGSTGFHEAKEPILVKKFFEAIGDLPAGYTEDEAADLFEMHANDPEPEIDDSDDYVSDEQKAKMAQFIAVHGAPDYNGHQWFITLHGEDAENFGDDDFEEAADLGIKIDYSYDTVTLTFPCCGYDDVYPDRSPSSPYEGRDDYEEIV